VLRLTKNDDDALVVSSGPGTREFELSDGQQLELLGPNDVSVPCEWRDRFVDDPAIVIRLQRTTGAETIGMISPEEGMLVKRIGPRPSRR
jgi:hypothetical protein